MARDLNLPLVLGQWFEALPLSTRLRGAANGYNVIDIADGQIALTVREWDGSRWQAIERAKAAAHPQGTKA